MSENTASNNPSSSKKSSSKSKDGERSIIAWANQKNNLASAVGAVTRFGLKQTDEMTESDYDKLIDKYRKMPPPRIK